MCRAQTQHTSKHIDVCRVCVVVVVEWVIRLAQIGLEVCAHVRRSSLVCCVLCVRVLCLFTCACLVGSAFRVAVVVVAVVRLQSPMVLT